MSVNEKLLGIIIGFTLFISCARDTTNIYGTHKDVNIVAKAKCDSCTDLFYYKFSEKLQHLLKLKPLNYAKDTFHFKLTNDQVKVIEFKTIKDVVSWVEKTDSDHKLESIDNYSINI